MRETALNLLKKEKDMKEIKRIDLDPIEADIEVEAVALEVEDLSNQVIGHLDQIYVIIAKKRGT